jgi:hypothetical protein
MRNVQDQNATVVEYSSPWYPVFLSFEDAAIVLQNGIPSFFAGPLPMPS